MRFPRTLQSEVIFVLSPDKAAHCFEEKKKNVADPKTHPTEIVVKLGKYDLSVLNERGSHTMHPSDIIIHPEWKTYEDRYNADLALIIFEAGAPITASIFPICLGFSHDIETIEIGYVVGWGKSESAAKHENIPKQLEVTIRTNEECLLKDHRFQSISSNKTFCAGKDNRSGPCKGDSGSGMVVRRGTGLSARWYIRGIVSAGFVEHGQCDVAVDVIFTNLLKFGPWIRKTATDNGVALPKPPRNGPKKAGRKSDKEIFCFFESWAEGRQGDEFNLDNLKPELCTTLVFLHAQLTNDNLDSIYPEQQLDSGRGWYRKFTDLKETHPHLRTLLAVGSWNEGSVKYSQLAANEARRKRFAKNSAEFLKSYNFDGLHFHWEKLHLEGVPEDKANFVKLLQDIKDVYEPENLFLSVFLRTQSEVVRKVYDLPKIGRIVDAALLMTFDYATSGDSKISYPAALYGQGENSVAARVKYFRDLGIPAEKLIVGIPLYGVPFNTKGQGNIGDRTSNSNGFSGPFYHFNFFLGYNEICEMRKNRQWQDDFIVDASQAVARSQNGDQTNVIVYDSPRSVANKVKFVEERDLGGVWTWFMTSDDWKGQCKPDNSAFADFTSPPREARGENDYPLTRTIYEAMELVA